jgi:hypothetical protein
MTIKNHAETPAADRASDLRRLTDSELDLVAGGITVSKRTDASSPDLFLKCATGTHYN